MAGDALISPQITVRLLHRLCDPAEPSPVRPGPVQPGAARPSSVQPGSARPVGAGGPLTDREAEIARLVARGCTNAEIGAELFISAGTAKTHLANIQAKLKVRNRVAVAAWAWESGLVAPGPRAAHGT